MPIDVLGDAGAPSSRSDVVAHDGLGPDSSASPAKASHRDMDRENGHCYFFDKLKGEGDEATATFKAAGFPCPLHFTATNPETADLISELVRLKSEDPSLERIHDLKIVAGK
jgi:hypothetical protein